MKENKQTNIKLFIWTPTSLIKFSKFKFPYLKLDNIENLNTVIISIRRKLDIIHSNMRNSAVRRSTHLDITNAINSKISYMTLAKIVFLLVFSAIQVKMLTSIFSNVKVVNTIIINEHKPIKSNPFDNSSDNVILWE